MPGLTANGGAGGDLARGGGGGDLAGGGGEAGLGGDGGLFFFLPAGGGDGGSRGGEAGWVGGGGGLFFLLILAGGGGGDALASGGGGLGRDVDATTLMVTGTSLDWPSELVTVTYTVGTGPEYPGAGVNVKVPSVRTTRDPVTLPVMGSSTCTAPEPGAMGLVDPGSLKPVTLTMAPGGGTAPDRMLPLTAVPGGVETTTGCTAS